MENTNITNVQVDDLTSTPEQTALIDKVIEYYKPKIGNQNIGFLGKMLKRHLGGITD